jgi:DNA polymerase V
MFIQDKSNLREKDIKIMNLLDNINNRYGKDSIKVAAEGIDQEWYMRQDKKSKCYTTRWDELLCVNI